MQTDKFDNIPEELRQLNRWVCWRIIQRDGKPTKVPVNPSTGGQAMSNYSSTWGAYQQAVSSVDKYNCQGIGFMFNGDGLLGVDLDHGRNPQTGELEIWASDIINELDSYTEVSQSGSGIHILCYGKLPSGRRRHGTVEMYETGRYFVMTGNVLDDAHTEIKDRAKQLADIHKKYMNITKNNLNLQKSEHNMPGLGEKRNSSLSPWEIIDKACSAKNGNKFRQLMNGDISTYNSQSEADLALCNIIAFYTQDASTLDMVYRQSKLMRDKWDERRGKDGTYGNIIINRAIQDAIAIYTPGKQSAKKNDIKNQIKNTKVENVNFIPGIIETVDCYIRIKRTEDRDERIQLTNFIIKPEKLIHGDESTEMEADILFHGRRKKTRFSSTVFSSMSAFKPFISSVLGPGAWFDGGQKELTLLQKLLDTKPVKVIKGMSCSGIHYENGTPIHVTSNGALLQDGSIDPSYTILSDCYGIDNADILNTPEISKSGLQQLLPALFSFNPKFPEFITMEVQHPVLYKCFVVYR